MKHTWVRDTCCVCGEKGMVYDVDLPCHVNIFVCGLDCENELFDEMRKHCCEETLDSPR